jgi:hypothetical protein
MPLMRVRRLCVPEKLHLPTMSRWVMVARLTRGAQLMQVMMPPGKAGVAPPACSIAFRLFQGVSGRV